MKTFLKLLGAAVGFMVLVFILFLALGIYLTSDPGYKYRTERKQLEFYIQEFESSSKIFRRQIEAKSYLQSVARKEKWEEKIDQVGRDFVVIKEKYIRSDDPGFYEKLSETELDALIAESREVCREGGRIMTDIENKINELKWSKETMPALMTRAQKQYAYMRKKIPARTLRLRNKAEKEWPQKKTFIDDIFNRLEAKKKSALVKYGELKLAVKKPLVKGERNAFERTARVMDELYQEIKKAQDALPEELDGLNCHWNKLVTDIEKRDGPAAEKAVLQGGKKGKSKTAKKKLSIVNSRAKNIPPRYFYRLKIIKLYRNGKKNVRERWIEVKKDFFYRYLDDLGMCIESKPMGKFSFEGDSLASPPGYSLVDDSEYGRWVGDPTAGDSYWVFNKKYAYAAALFWGGAKVFKQKFQSFRRAHGDRIGFFEDGRYGTDSQRVRNEFAKSKYVSTLAYIAYRTERRLYMRSIRSYGGGGK